LGWRIGCTNQRVESVGDNVTYTAKTNWTAADGVSAADLNRIEQGIADITTSALPATSYTAADVLTKIKTVDGNGSGLDADLVKGYTPVK
jgi:hypothetical protein